MLIGTELAAWLSDKDAQRRTQQRIDGFAQGWRQGPVHRRLDALFQGLADPNAEAVTEAVTTLFADDAWIGSLIDGLAEALRHDPYLEPPFSALGSDIHSGLLIYENPSVALSAGVTRADALAAKKNVVRGRVSIGFTGQVSVLKFVASGDALLSFWEAPRISDGFTAAGAGSCRRTGERRIGDGEILVCDGRRQSYVIEQARSNLVLVQATLKVEQAPLAVEYDAVTHEYVGCSSTSDVASRIQMLTTLLRKLGHEQAFAAIAGFLDHRDFFVRWHVMRELLGVDAMAALPHLERMAEHDPHEDNRAAASKVLALFPSVDQKKAA